MNVQLVKSTDFSIGEPSFADVLEAIAATPDLDDAQKRHWSTSVRQLALYLGMPPASIPGRISAISGSVSKLHPARLGINPKTFSNHRSNSKAALRWFNRQTLGSARCAPMSSQLRFLWHQIGDRHAKDMISPFLRFLTAKGVDLHNVSDAEIAAYADYRRLTSFNKFSVSKLRQLVRHWNGCRRSVHGWPDIVLMEPPRVKAGGPVFADFPAGLRHDIEAYCAYLAKPHKARDGRLMKGCASSTVNLNRRVLIAAIRTAVTIGIPLEDLQSLGDLLKPERAEAIIDAYWKRDGKKPSIYTIDLAAKFLAVARIQCRFAAEDLARLDDMRRLLEDFRPAGLTEKNRAVVRQVLQSGLWSKVVQLPACLMAQADADRKSAPNTSAVTAQIATAIRILSVAPIRMQNLTQIEIGVHLVRPGGPGSNYSLTFERYDVKNSVALDFELDAMTSSLIDRYIVNHRPHLMRGRNHNRLFPGTAGDNKASDTFGLQITKRLWACLGIRLTPHQFRHAAAALVLRKHPGNYELVRQLLSHKSIRTTMAFYIGLKSITATRAFAEIVTENDQPMART